MKKNQRKIDIYPKFSYEKEDDILMIELNSNKIDYAQQSGDLIVHFSPQREAVLLEILDASSFLKHQAASLPPEVRQKFFAN